MHQDGSSVMLVALAALAAGVVLQLGVSERLVNAWWQALCARALSSCPPAASPRIQCVHGMDMWGSLENKVPLRTVQGGRKMLHGHNPELSNLDNQARLRRKSIPPLSCCKASAEKPLSSVLCRHFRMRFPCSGELIQGTP